MAHPRIASAFRAMKALGISEDKVKPALKRLLKLYNKNWDLIEEENYRPLIDAIFDNEEAEAEKRLKSSTNAEEDNFKEEEVAHEEPIRPLKRLRLIMEARLSSPSSLGGTSQVRHDVEGAELLGLHNPNGHMDSEPQPASCQYIARNKGVPVSGTHAELLCAGGSHDNRMYHDPLLLHQLSNGPALGRILMMSLIMRSHPLVAYQNLSWMAQGSS
nr:probable inactive histone-lysine N-methyltransferase SUVR1 isoform X2 [Ipomoea trifida]